MKQLTLTTDLPEALPTGLPEALPTASTESKRTTSEEKNLKAYMKKCDEVGQFCNDLHKPLVIHHYDADGMSAGAATIWALKRLGKEPLHLTKRQLTESELEHIASFAKENGCDGIIVVDLAARYLNAKEKILENFRVAFIDHHEQPEVNEEGTIKELVQANAHEFGEHDYSYSSASSAVYFCFRQFGFYDLAELGIVGAVGDQEDEGGLKGANAEMVREAQEKGFCKKAIDLRLFGKVSRTLPAFLAFCDEPFIPGISGDERRAAKFLMDNGFELTGDEDAEGRKKWLHYYELSEPEKKRLASALVNHCLANGLPSEIVEQMIGEVYYLPKRPEKTELSEAYEFSTLLNACGRHDHIEIGLKACMSEEGAFEEARKVLGQHRALIRQGLFLARKKAVDLGNFYFFDGRGEVSDSVIGTVANAIRGSAIFKEDKPFIAFSTNEKGELKISSRGSKGLLARGLDLNKVMGGASEGFGLGGGHKLAAGANCKAGCEAEFLKRCAKIIAEQLENKPTAL